MPIAEITAPDGRIAHITFPEGATKDQILAYAKSQWDSGAIENNPVQANTQKSETNSSQEKPLTTSAGRTVLEQILQGATFGRADEITDRIGAGIGSLFTDEDYGTILSHARKASQKRLQAQAHERPVLSIASNLAGGLLTAGAFTAPKVIGSGIAATKGIRGAINAVPKAGQKVTNYLRSGSSAKQIGKAALFAGGQNMLYGTGTAREGERLKGAGYNFLSGAVLGGSIRGLPIAYGGVKNIAKSTVIPNVAKKIKPLAKRAREFGIPLRADQVSPSSVRDTVQKISQKVPFSGVDKFEENQLKAFTKAIAKTIGEEADDLSPETIGRFHQSAGRKFNDVLSGETIRIAPNDLKKISSIKSQAADSISADLLGIVNRNVNNVISDLKKGKGKVTGEKLTSIRSQLIKKASKVQGGAKGFVNQIVNKIDDIASDNLPPDKVKQLATARREWRNFKTIEPLLEKSTDGTINPTQLLSRVASSKYIKASSSDIGNDDLVDIARIGKRFLIKKGGSDTIEKGALIGSGAIGLASPLLLAASLAGNRGFQKINQSQALIDKALRATGATSASVRPRPSPLLTISGANAAINYNRNRAAK